MTAPLEPCPFCGGTDVGDADADEWSRWACIQCRDCMAQGAPVCREDPHAEERAAAMWNRRSATAAPIESTDCQVCHGALEFPTVLGPAPCPTCNPASPHYSAEYFAQRRNRGLAGAKGRVDEVPTNKGPSGPRPPHGHRP